ncbi:hypothetical protein ACFVUB_09315 [Streptomyces niveus]|uniref:hypothetical protein n=1 Tax=Streptomyces niveus TaxID=193462 RepID=UPI0036DF57BE
MYVDDVSTQHRPYAERRTLLEGLFVPDRLGPPWTLCPAASVTDLSTLRTWMSWSVVGVESLVLEDPRQRYRAGVRGGGSTGSGIRRRRWSARCPVPSPCRAVSCWAVSTIASDRGSPAAPSPSPRPPPRSWRLGPTPPGAITHGWGGSSPPGGAPARRWR